MLEITSNALRLQIMNTEGEIVFLMLKMGLMQLLNTEGELVLDAEGG